MSQDHVMAILETKQGAQHPVTLEISEDEDSGRYNISLFPAGLEGRRWTGSGEDLFAALCELRMQLEQSGLLLRCAGSDLNVYPSSMSRSMGEGRKAFRLTPGLPASLADLVDIFDASSMPQGSTVAEQKAFFERWFESIGK